MSVLRHWWRLERDNPLRLIDVFYTSVFKAACVVFLVWSLTEAMPR